MEELAIRLIFCTELQLVIVIGKIKNVRLTKLFVNSTSHRKVAERWGYSSSNTVILHYNRPFTFLGAILNKHVFRMTNFNTVARVYILSELKISMFGIDVNFYENKLAKKNTLYDIQTSLKELLQTSYQMIQES